MTDAADAGSRAPDPAATYHLMLRRLPKAERFLRALALTAYVRDLTWQGATRRAGELGSVAVVDRFILQLYGPTVAREFRAARESRRG